MTRLNQVNLYALELGDDEMDVVLEVMRGLVGGRQVYGELDLDTDKRDFAAEGGEELRDLIVYAACLKLRLDRFRNR